MLTLVGLVNRVDQDFDTPIYHRIALVSKLAAFSLAGAVGLLLLLAMPVAEFDNMSPQWYPMLYKILYAGVVALSALLVGTVVLLYQTVRSLIAHVTPREDV
ncbi:hypothetical protein [uncultured Parasphingopyxis sp.]|uniref:hypothetical protein n=1 Tax=uncultured Parasphingopyxis sp. TaxID=1547918 RepID=UPI0026299857|nr:hypothetical protein [uncultured Parasphingopyxis sp.]